MKFLEERGRAEGALVEQKELLKALVGALFPVGFVHADAFGELEVSVIGDEGFVEEDLDLFVEFLGVDETFFVVEFGGDRGSVHGFVHFFVHFADLIDGSEGPFGVSQADGVEVEALCAQEVAGFVVEIFFHFGLREAEAALFEAKMIDASPIILGHGGGIVDLAEWSFFSEVESDGEAEERLGLFVLL